MGSGIGDRALHADEGKPPSKASVVETSKQAIASGRQTLGDRKREEGESHFACLPVRDGNGSNG